MQIPSCGTMNQLFTPPSWRLFKRAWDFANPVYICFVDLKKAYDCVPRDILWDVLQQYWWQGPYSRPFDLCTPGARVVSVYSALSLFTVSIGLCEVCALSPLLFVIFVDRVFSHSRGQGQVLSWPQAGTGGSSNVVTVPGYSGEEGAES